VNNGRSETNERAPERHVRWRSSPFGWELGGVLAGWLGRRCLRLVALFRVVFALAFGVLLLLSF
jgi:hypothetical protein